MLSSLSTHAAPAKTARSLGRYNQPRTTRAKTGAYDSKQCHEVSKRGSIIFQDHGVRPRAGFPSSPSHRPPSAIPARTSHFHYLHPETRHCVAGSRELRRPGQPFWHALGPSLLPRPLRHAARTSGPCPLPLHRSRLAAQEGAILVRSTPSPITRPSERIATTYTPPPAHA